MQGIETFWNDADGSEAILQVQAASPSVAMSEYRATAVPTGLPAQSSTQTAQTRVRKKSKADLQPVQPIRGPIFDSFHPFVEFQWEEPLLAASV